MSTKTQFHLKVSNSNHARNFSKLPNSEKSILVDASELFAQRTSHTIEEKKIFLELALNFLPTASAIERRKVACALANHPEIPDEVLQLLVNDKDEQTAYPIFRYNERLSVDLLLRISKEGPTNLRKAIANRLHLDDSVILSLCANADSSVLRILIERDDISLTEKQRVTLQKRPDVAQELSAELIEKDVRSSNELITQFLCLPKEQKTKAIAAAEMARLIEQVGAFGVTKKDPTNTNGTEAFDTLMREALEQNQESFAKTLSSALNIPLKTSWQLLDIDQLEGLAVALKSLDITAANFTTTLVRLHGNHLKLQELRSIVSLFSALNIETAKLIARHWSGEKQGATVSTPSKQVAYTEQFQETGRRKYDTQTRFNRTDNQFKRAANS